MTIGGLITYIIFSIFTVAIVFWIYAMCDGRYIALPVIISIVLIILMFLGFRWYYNNTASGIRALTDQKAELSNGLDRVINIYTANGDLIATYSGKIDLEDNAGGYILFDFDGKRYTYYNCFVESIAEIN